MRHAGFELTGSPDAVPPALAEPQPQLAPPALGTWARAVQLLRITLCGLAFLGFGLGGWILAWLALPLLRLWPGSQFQKHQRCQSVVRLAWILFHDYMRWAGLVAFDHRQVNLAISHPAVIIANHPTLIDITALVTAIGPVCFVAKRALFRNVLYGPLLRACGHICGGMGDEASGTPALDQSLARLAAGHSVLLFPEGTRSPIGGLNRFRVGAFELARRAQVPLVVISIDARPLGLYKGVPWYAIPTKAMRLQLEYVTTVNNWHEVPDVKALCAVRDEVRELLHKRIQAATNVDSLARSAAAKAAGSVEMQDKSREA